MEEKKIEKILDISWKTILKISITIICFYILYSIRDIIIWFLFALTLSILFNPAVDFLQKKKIPRILGVMLVYFSFFGIFAFVFYLMVPLVNSEVHQFLQIFPQYFEKISPPLRGLGFETFKNIDAFIEGIGKTLEKMSENIFNIFVVVFGGIASFLFVVTTSFFLSLEEKPIERALCLLFPKKYEAYVLNLWEKCQREIAGWFGARVLACLFVGVMTFISLLIFDVKYPAILGLFAGVFNFIPYVGPFITGALFFILIFPTEAVKAILIIIIFIIIQQIENNALTPILMKKLVGIPPALVLVSLIIGGKLWGLLGALLAIPLFGVLFNFSREFLKERRDKKAEML